MKNVTSYTPSVSLIISILRCVPKSCCKGRVTRANRSHPHAPITCCVHTYIFTDINAMCLSLLVFSKLWQINGINLKRKVNH